MTLRGRLLLFSALHMALAAVLFTALWWRTRHDTSALYVEFLDNKSTTNIHRATSELIVALGANDATLLTAIADDAPRDPDFLGLHVLDAVGVQVIARGALPPADLWHESALTPHATHEYLWVWNTVSVEGLELGRVALGFKRARVDEFNRVMRWMAFAGVAALVVASVLALVFARSLVRPLEAMMAFCRRVAHGDFNRHLDVPAPGELAELRNDLNLMAQGLVQRERELLVRQRQLESSLKLLRETQHEFAQATRLAAVGEMAGRTAHEVLNPVTSMRGRVSRMQAYLRDTVDPNLEVLRQIVDGQRGTFQHEGVAGYVRALEQAVPGPDGGERTLLEEDLDNLAGLTDLLTTTAGQLQSDYEFLDREINRITHIVDGMRSLTRRTGTATVLRLHEVMQETAEILHDTLDKRHVTLDIRVADSPTVLADRYELLQILTNLVRNSLHAIEEKAGREGGRVELAASTQDGRAELRIKDNGTGIRPEHLPLLFESSFTTRPAHEGTGLGLSIARRLARQCGGDLAVEHTELGHGTTFLMTLPLYDSRRPAGAPPQEKQHVA